MHVLLDECLPRRLRRWLVGHDVKTAPEMGWASKRNGELLEYQRHADVGVQILLGAHDRVDRRADALAFRWVTHVRQLPAVIVRRDAKVDRDALARGLILARQLIAFELFRGVILGRFFEPVRQFRWRVAQCDGVQH